MEFGIFRLQTDAFAKTADGVVQPAFPGQSQAEIVAWLRITSVDANGFQELRNGVVNLAAIKQRNGNVFVGNGVVFCGCECVAKKRLTVSPTAKMHSCQDD